MWHFEHSVVTRAPRDEAWRYLTDFRNHVRLEKGVDRIELDGPFATGTTGRTVSGGLAQDWTLTEVVDGARFAIKGETEDGTGSLRFVWNLEDDEGGGTRLTQRIEAAGSAMAEVEELRAMERGVPASMARVVVELDAVANKAVVRRFYEEVVSTGDVERVPSFIGEECVETDGRVRVESGIEGMIEHVRGVRSVYPDLRITVGRQVAEGDWVASAITATGTHAGEWLGMAPTGQVLEFTGVNVDRVVDGRIVEHGGAANMLMPFLEAGARRPVAQR